MEYIAFLKSLPAINGQEESHRMTTVRKVYQKAIVTPTHHIEQLWKDYENFENSVSRQLAKGLISEYQPKYNSARAVYRERKKYVDEIDWNMLAVPPSGSYKCLMYMYHYPDIWYDYATWHAKGGSIDAAIKVFQRALKALPDSEMLRYAYAELEESRGAIQAAKKIYESLLGDGVNATTLAHIQFIRFLRRTEGVEAARKYFLDARKSPSCTYHVYVAYATMAFCLDKDPKVSSFFILERTSIACKPSGPMGRPRKYMRSWRSRRETAKAGYVADTSFVLEVVDGDEKSQTIRYADFLIRMNDDQNIRALFERALSSLPPEESLEVWKKFTQFEQTYGDLASMLKVEQRRKEALSGAEDGTSLESSLQDIVSRYSFMDLWPCSSNDLDHLARQEWLTKNINKRVEKCILANGTIVIDKTSMTNISSTSPKIVYPDTSKMVIYDPKHTPVTGSGTNAFDEILKATPPALVAFLANLPAVEGPTPNVDIVLSICLQSDLPTGQSAKIGISTQVQTGKGGIPSQLPAGSAPATSELSGSSKSHPVPSGVSLKPGSNRQYGKRKESERQEDDDTTTVQSQPLPRDAFRIRQYQKARASSASQTGSVSYGSAFSGDLSGSTG
ncbi:hypothetical protein ACSQ67_025900 [Phaseolus vulgaris]